MQLHAVDPRALLSRSAGAFVVMLVLLVLSSAIYFGQAGDMEVDQYSLVVLFDNPLKPSWIYFLTYAFGAIVGIAVLMRRLPATKGGFIHLFLALGALHLAWLPFAESDAITARTFVMRMNVVVMTVACQIIFSALTDMRAVLRATRCVVWATALLNLLIIVVPDLFGIRMGVYPGRASGLYWDPNQCATFLALLLPLVNHGLSRPRRWLQSLVVLVGILFTFSREGALLWAVAVLLSELMLPGEARPKRLARNTLVVGSVAAIVLTTLALGWGALIELLHPYLNSDTYARLSGFDEGSSSERMEVLRAGWNLFISNPLVGAGYAATRSWGYGVSVHNMFVLLLAEFGLVGGFWYVAFLMRVFTLPLRFGVVLGGLVALESLFSHSYFDSFYYMLLVLIYWRFAHLLAESQRAAP